MEQSPSPEDRSAIIAATLVTGLAAVAYWLGQKAAVKLEKREMFANRLVEFFEGDDLIKASADFNKLADRYTEQQALDIVLYRGGVHEYH